MTIGRYAFGLYFGGFIAFINVLTCVGWSMVNTMAGAEAFYAMTNTKLPLTICILILAIGYFFPSFTNIDLTFIARSLSDFSDIGGSIFMNAIHGW
jgi:hypothetical protein